MAFWIPACAGMTGGQTIPVSGNRSEIPRFARNDGMRSASGYRGWGRRMIGLKARTGWPGVADGGRPGFDPPVLLANILTPALSLPRESEWTLVPRFRGDMLHGNDGICRASFDPSTSSGQAGSGCTGALLLRRSDREAKPRRQLSGTVIYFAGLESGCGSSIASMVLEFRSPNRVGRPAFDGMTARSRSRRKSVLEIQSARRWL